MSNVRLAWQLPTPSSRQRPIGHSRIEARVSDALPWTPIANVPAPQEGVVIENVDPGTWFYMLVIVDDLGEDSDPVFTDTSLAYDRPSPATGFSATVEG